MRIKSLHVSGSKTLRNGGISELDISFVADTAIILGTNGCGKSLTLSYLDPAPAPTTTFENWGRRDVVYQTAKGDYTISTDYSCQSSPHTFIDPTGENLNVGQTSRMQSQLCESELGLTDFVVGLMMNRATLVKKTEGQRRAFLMNITPTPIGFILDQQKDVERKIRDTNANISRLNERKLKLEQDLLSPEEVATLEKEEHEIQLFLEQIQKELHFIEYADQSVSPEVRTPSENLIPRIRKTITEISDRARHHVKTSYPAEHLADALKNTSDLISQKSGISEAWTERVVEIRNTLTQTEERIKALGVASEYAAMEDRIREITHEITINENTPVPETMLSRKELEICLDNRRVVADTLSEFVSVGVAIYSRNKLNRKTEQNHHYRRFSQRLSSQISQVISAIDELKSDRSIKTEDIPTPCSGDACPLYRGCAKKEKRISQEIQDHETDLKHLLHKKMWLEHYFSIAGDVLSVQRDIHEKLKVLWDLARGNPVLQSLLRRDDILVVLRRSPIKIYRDMDVILGQIAWAYQKNDLQAELSELHASVSRFKAAGDGSLQALEQSIQQEEKRLSEQMTGLEMIAKEIQSLSKHRTAIMDFSADLKTLDDLEDTVQKKRALYSEWIKKEIRSKRKRVLKDRQTDLLSRIGDIRKIIRDQSLLRSRYDEEVISQLTILERNRAVLMQVCHELIMAPREYMVPFVNTILTIVNDLIKRYWTQPIEFVLWTVDEDLNYQFPHIKKGNLVKDMDFGSEGERDLFTLVFNLAIRIVRQKTDIPLCLDEVGRTFDEKHKGNLVRLLTHVMEQKWASQMIIVNHDPMVHEGFQYADIIVLNAENIHTPEVYNEHVSIA